MRPVRLEMHGFAAFREPTTVDFTGTEYFALVGPTGSGKSTVIDAMTFALYGSVPRWDDRRTVALAMAPSVNRGTVRLVFDAGGARYVVARELRRSARGGVTVRNARLERLADPAEVDGDTEVLAADSDVTREVERLLGLPFDQFCQCVVLPQGDFAEFLHAKPSDRQKMLTRLLGLDVYETIAKEANREAAAAGERAEVMAGQLAAYADATDEAVSAAGERVAALEALSGRVAARLPELTAAAAAVSDAEEVVTRLRDERSRLAALSVPNGLSDVDSRRRAAVARAEAAQQRFAAAETADTAAREARAAAPERGPLEQARRDHADLATALAAQPGARETHAAALAAYESATAAAASAAAAVEAARTDRDTAATALQSAREAAQRLADERGRLTGLRVPDGLDRLDSRRRAADDDLAAAQKALDAAEAADTAAREELAAAPARGPLEQARADHAALAAALAAEPGVTQRHAGAVRAREAAAEQVAQARHRVTHARERRDAAARADRAAALRPSLVAGEPCPVCEQVVVTPPPMTGAADLTATEDAVGAAEQALETARAEQTAAAAAEQRAAVDLERATGEIARLRAALSGAPPTAAATADALATLDRIAQAAEQADATMRRARRDREDAARAVDAVRGELAAAVTALRTARDPLVPLGAPAVTGDDVLAGWTALAGWAEQEIAIRDAALPGARDAATAAEQAAGAAVRAFEGAEQTAAARRGEETAAARAEQAARSDLDALDDRIGRLRAALETAPSDAEAARELARLDTLDAAVRAADAELRAARSARSAADTALAEVNRDVTAAWDTLRAARDPLVVLGAPAATGDDLLAAWTTLADWATAAGAERAGRLPAAESAVAAARDGHDGLGRALADDLAGHDVPARAPLGETAPAAVAEALARARAARERIAERRDEAATLRADRAEAETAQQVAKMLGNLLRSDGFPRWLVASALDVLVADASASLAELSGGQFELTHADGEFLVVDHADADAHRPVKTLSGGETFQASLALALALSAQMSTLAAEGAARLDSIFLDEGFGTLDEANLEVVASTLENLANQGDRMVGVITHVPALAERVPVRYAVSRDRRTASVVREGL
ncbi:AAA family ATPase [Pseudonocardia acidicola]|uniref:Nuclease SbcCD subunit C n=1 Tax=Pseudonocardia acidicola TaxID=2724939 RepID=A0ABX1S2G8_9PSEU|nr:AAA family ATPase [Pseudonocardia acidicola]NMH95755.1 SMC family ATPase [Pseudonocardia acidicola]